MNKLHIVEAKKECVVCIHCAMTYGDPGAKKFVVCDLPRCLRVKE